MSHDPGLSEREVAQAAAEVAAVTAAVARELAPNTYVSRRRGPVPIEAMSPVWATHAAAAVKRGDRPEDPRSVVKPLEIQARKGGR
jgi:hypothetical protein